LTLEVKFQQD